MHRRTFIKNTGIIGGAVLASPLLKAFPNNFENAPYTLMDLHVHFTESFTIEMIMELAQKRNVKIGIVEHPADWALKNDEDLKSYITKLRQYPVFIGLQPLTSGWTSRFSPELLKQIDYVLMDPQTIPLPNGDYERIYELSCYIDDSEAFMERYMNHSLNILRNEPITIFGWPLFLPVCIAREYYELWTKKRMTQIIEAAAARKIAIEINDMAHTPHEKFILMAKEAGLKFTFGSDSRNNNVGRLVYCKSIAEKCKLTSDDFYIPGKS